MPKNNTRKNNTRKNNARKNNGNKAGGSANGLFSTVVKPVTGTFELAGDVAGRGLNLAVNVPLGAVKGVKNILGKSLRNLTSGVGRLGNNTASGLNRTVRRAFGSSRSSRNSRNSRK